MKKKSYKFFGIKYKVKILRIAVGLKKKGTVGVTFRIEV